MLTTMDMPGLLSGPSQWHTTNAPRDQAAVLQDAGSELSNLVAFISLSQLGLL